jgi:type I restriction enzyme S subunit
MYTDDFFDMPIVCPPLDEQIQIIKYIDDAAARVDHAIGQAEREIELMQEYRTTLISDVVTGKVDVRNEGEKTTV